SPPTLRSLFVLLSSPPSLSSFFFFTDPAPPEIYTLSLHDALPISARHRGRADRGGVELRLAGHPEHHHLVRVDDRDHAGGLVGRSEEHTSELQSLTNLVCRLLLEKKKKIKYNLPAPLYKQRASTRT